MYTVHCGSIGAAVLSLYAAGCEHCTSLTKGIFIYVRGDRIKINDIYYFKFEIKKFYSYPNIYYLLLLRVLLPTP